MFYDVSRCITMFYKCFMMFYYVLRCLVSRATIGIGDRAAADRLRDCDNATGIGDDCAEIGDDAKEIGDDAAGIVAIAAKVIPC